MTGSLTVNSNDKEPTNRTSKEPVFEKIHRPSINYAHCRYLEDS